jgi:hypothetical protein
LVFGLWSLVFGLRSSVFVFGFSRFSRSPVLTLI